jgi:rhodanese-related sulfurtransferase
MDVPIKHDTRLIVICAEGFSSSLAAASLKGLGLRRATDVIGGFEGWVQAGLPVARARPRSRMLADGSKLAGEGGFEPPIS